jgi:hypothetical protein
MTMIVLMRYWCGNGGDGDNGGGDEFVIPLGFNGDDGVINEVVDDEGDNSNISGNDSDGVLIMMAVMKVIMVGMSGDDD